MTSDRAVLWAFVLGLALWAYWVTRLVIWGGWLAGVGLVSQSVALVMIIARPRVFAWLDRRGPGAGDGRGGRR